MESFALRAAILHECQNYLGGGGGLGGFETTGWVTTHLVYPVLKPTISFLVKDSRYRDFLIKQTMSTAFEISAWLNAVICCALPSQKLL